jgi:hypothetical protein
VSDSDVVKAASIKHGVNGAACVTLQAANDGEAEVQLGNGEDAAIWYIQVKDGVIVEGGIDFSGWESIHVCVIVVMTTLALLFLSVVVRLVRASYYGYEMVACGGGFLFTLFSCLRSV